MVEGKNEGKQHLRAPLHHPPPLKMRANLPWWGIWNINQKTWGKEITLGDQEDGITTDQAGC
jgi:hypothetical protein